MKSLQLTEALNCAQEYFAAVHTRVRYTYSRCTRSTMQLHAPGITCRLLHTQCANEYHPLKWKRKRTPSSPAFFSPASFFSFLPPFFFPILTALLKHRPQGNTSSLCRCFPIPKRFPL
eukprot:9468111-Pyramimonas_sp.AAC.1